jgi:hypothetical protein
MTKLDLPPNITLASFHVGDFYFTCSHSPKASRAELIDIAQRLNALPVHTDISKSPPQRYVDVRPTEMVRDLIVRALYALAKSLGEPKR